jgi:pectate lyase
MLQSSALLASSSVCLILALAACSGSESDDEGAGATGGVAGSLPGSGGAGNAAGTTPQGGSATGGTPATGGTSGAGVGGTAMGGSSGAASGGQPTGGSAGTGAGGGSDPATGGSAGSGVSGSAGDGGTNNGGSTSGGASGSGGTPTAGAGGSGNAGSGGSGGAPTGEPDPNNGADGSERPIGFANVSGMGLDTTTGGSGGPTVTVATLAELAPLLDQDDPTIILVNGEIDLEGNMVPMRSNKSLIGLDGARLFNGGLEMNRRQNIIVRNITFADGADDTFKINQNTHHVWVDHCDFTRAADGLFDITRQSSFITISWNKFYEHSKTMLIGHSDSASDDTGYLKTTVHHNWFNGTEQRHPRVRFGEVHVFNNYFLSNALYGVASTMEADVVVEGNFFEGVEFPIYVGYDESAEGDAVERNNVYQNSGTPETRGTAFDPMAAYPYIVENPTTIPDLVRAKSGVGIIDPMAAAR